MKRRRGSSTFVRSSGTKSIGCRHFVFCEGKTEAEFLNSFRQHHRLAAVKVEVVGRVGDPGRIVEEATKKRDELKTQRGQKRGVDWLVHVAFDRDEHPRFASACNDAKQRDLVLGVSVPCFELFLIWLHEDSFAALTRKNAQRRCKSLNPGYCHEKNPIIDFQKVASNIEEAMERAEKRRSQCIDEDFPNPSSSFDLILRAIIELDSATDEGP